MIYPLENMIASRMWSGVLNVTAVQLTSRLMLRFLDRHGFTNQSELKEVQRYVNRYYDSWVMKPN